MEVCMHVVSPVFMSCVTFNYLPKNTNICALRAHVVEETVENLKNMQLSCMFRKCADLLRQLYVE